MSALSALASVDRDTVRTFLAGDLVAIAAFLVAGGYRHATLADPARFAGASLPFVVGWAVVGPLAGAYSGRVRAGAGWLVGLTAGAWVGAAVVAQALRATEPLPGDADPVFFLVTVGFGGGLLVAWRLLRVRFGTTPRATAGPDAPTGDD